MNLLEAQELLTIIAAYDRGGFPDNAAELVWYPALRGVAYADARAAVDKHYRINARDPHTGAVRRVLPVEVARVAEDIRAARLRAEGRRAIEAAPGKVGVPAQSKKARALLAKFREENTKYVKRYREQAA